jgi:hypothetical protein
VPTLPGLTYDPGAGGGTTTIEVDGRGRRLREYVSLAGTHNNCAGGITPWGTWLSCEESEQRAGGQYRYAHEAVAVDPYRHAIYLTEDASGPNGLYYRWVPPHGFRGGKGALRALARRRRAGRPSSGQQRRPLSIRLDSVQSRRRESTSCDAYSRRPSPP